MTTSGAIIENSQALSYSSSCWSDLPIDILCQVADRLPYLDLVHSATVCKAWRLAIHGVHLPQRSTLLVPYLMNFTCIGDRKHIEFFDVQDEPYKYTVEHVLLNRNIKPFASKCGWFLLTKKEATASLNTKEVRLCFVHKQYFYLYNPFSHEVIPLPGFNLESGSGFYVDIATFTTPPTSPDCVIFVLCKNISNENCNISTYKLAERRWTTCRTTCKSFAEGVTYLDGIFYFIFPRHEYSWGTSAVFIRTFDIAFQEWVTNYPSIPMKDHNKSRTFYVVESIDGKLLLAVSDLANDVAKHYWFVYQFNRSRKEWTRLPSLGNQVLLLSKSSSIACATVGKDSKYSDMIFHLNWGKEPFTLSSDGVWRRKPCCSHSLSSSEWLPRLPI